MRLSFYRFTSSLQLILTGFFLLALLVIIGQLASILSVDRLARESRESIYAAAETLHLSQVFATDVTFLERAARQYHVLRDQEVFDVYLERRARFLQDAQRLAARPLTSEQRRWLQEALAEESAIHRVLTAAGGPGRNAVERFSAMDSAARAILADSGELVSRAVEQIQLGASETQRRLVVQAVALIPGAIILALVYSMLINRPIRQIKSAITSLGEGRFLEGVKVSGPRDLEELGRQLDWLRLRLRALEQHKVTIVRNISHELKTPLAAIHEGIELLHDEVPGKLNRQQAEIARILRANCARLQKLIDDLIHFSIAQAEDPFLNERPIQLHRLLASVIDEQKPLLASRRLEVQSRLAEATVIGERDKLKSVFDNLLSNAIKYSPPDGVIEVTLSRADGRAIVDVRDQGPGIDPRERGRIFDAFFQGRPAPQQTLMQGSGLGLAIAHAYTRLHKGSIEVVDSKTGAHIRVALPLAGA